MIVSFDLDGTICDSDGAMLGLLHDRYRKAAIREEWLYAEELLRRYYTTRRMVLDPRDFTLPGDTIIVITGRLAMTQDWTREWLRRWLPGVECCFVGDEESEDFFAAGEYVQGSRVLARKKLATIRFFHVQAHFDNNAHIIEELRQEGIVAIPVGRPGDDV